MKLLAGALKKIQTAVTDLATDGVVWDLTSRYPLDEHIETVALLLIQLLELRGISRYGQQGCSARDDGVCGVVCRARTTQRSVKLVVVSESNATGSREEAKIITFYPEDRRDKQLDYTTNGVFPEDTWVATASR